METLMVMMLLVGSVLAGTYRGERDEYNEKAVEFFMGDDKLPAMLEMTPSKNCLEGDMEMSEEQKEVYYMMREATAENRARVRRAAAQSFRRWPDKTLVYKFDSRLSTQMRNKFKEAVKVYEEATCINFIEATDEYTGNIPPINIKGHGSGCSSTVGGPGGNMNLQENRCDHLGVCLHEIGHALGMYHEQTRPDRADHVHIEEGNIKPGFEGNFKMVDRELSGIYDAQSIMHYSSTAFSKDGRSPTIIPVDPDVIDKMGKQQKLSRLDIFKFNNMYNCYENCPTDLDEKCQHWSLPSKDCKCLCPDEYTGPYCETFNKKTSCSEEFKEPAGVLKSPDNPSLYGNNRHCVYAIECPEGQRVRIKFITFDIEGWGCFFDVFETKIHDIVDEIYPSEYCDRDLEGKILTSRTNLALMTFKSDYMIDYPGFKAEYHCE